MGEGGVGVTTITLIRKIFFLINDIIIKKVNLKKISIIENIT
jgi:hypothetical protein